MHAEAIETKSRGLIARLERLAHMDGPGVLDLFSGCGGMTLGFHRAGFRPLGGVELDKHAARSHAENFHGHLKDRDPELFERFALARNIRDTDPRTLLDELGIEPDDVHVIIGGPPCPAFTRVGRAKLRQVHADPDAYKNDQRWTLYRPYLDFVEALQPLALVMENVPDIINFGGENVAEDIAVTLEDLGYRVAYTLLNAVHYGVPQMRDRFVLLAFKDGLDIDPSFPQPTHRFNLPRGYHSSRNVALRTLNRSHSGAAFSTTEGIHLYPGSRYVEPPKPLESAVPAVTVGDALGDLNRHEPARRGPRRLDTPVPYGRSRRLSAYASTMRAWPGFATDGGVTAHVTRALSERDVRLFRNMMPGDDYPAAHRLACSLFGAAVQEAGGQDVLGQVALTELHKRYVPPYDTGKFPNKWRKMDPTEPARTLMAHLGKDSYTHIHYDSGQHRVLTVREAARLQSFPDGFLLHGAMNAGFRQIGNAVPPLLSWHLAMHIKQRLADACQAEAGQCSFHQVPQPECQVIKP